MYYVVIIESLKAGGFYGESHFKSLEQAKKYADLFQIDHSKIKKIS